MNIPSNDTQAVKLSGEEVAKHDSEKSCWVIVHGRAYGRLALSRRVLYFMRRLTPSPSSDVTEFMPEHPGGMKIILKYAGKDATEA